MDRRRFLSSTMLAGFGFAAAARPAAAFTRLDCTTHPNDAGCSELLRHKTLIADIERDLEKRGVPKAEREALLARAVCPYCGQLLIG